MSVICASIARLPLTGKSIGNVVFSTRAGGGFDARTQGRKGDGRLEGVSLDWRYCTVAYDEAGDMRQEAGVNGVRVGGGD